MSVPSSSKPASDLSHENVLRSAHNDQLKVLGVGGFIGQKVGHRITLQINTTNVANDTELYSYFDGAVQIMQIEIVYVDGSRETIQSVERVA